MKIVRKVGLTAGVLILLVGILFGAIKLSKSITAKQMADANQKMYTALKQNGQYSLKHGRTVVLTEKGQALLQPNLSFVFDADNVKNDIGFDIQHAYVSAASAEGEITIPENIKDGTVLKGKLPFDFDKITGDAKITLYLGDHKLEYNLNHIQRIGTISSKKFGVMVGYNYDDGKKIANEKYLQKFKGEKIKYKFTGFILTPAKKETRKVQRISKKPLIIHNNVQLNSNSSVTTFEITSYEDTPNVVKLIGTLDGADISDKLSITSQQIHKYSNSMIKYRVSVNTKVPLVGDKLKIAMTVSGKFASTSYNSASTLKAF